MLCFLKGAPFLMPHKIHKMFGHHILARFVRKDRKTCGQDDEGSGGSVAPEDDEVGRMRETPGNICLSIYVAFVYRVHPQSFSIRSILNAIDYIVDCKK